MRYCFSDVNPTLFNLEGQPFYGKLVFVAPGTSKTYRNIFDVDDHNLGHVITTNQYGRLEKQIILDGTYDVQYWEYTGTEFDIEDKEQWTLIRTERVIDPEDNITLSVDGVATVDTMADLRAIDVKGLSPHTVILRTGYYQNGDHEPLFYCWEPSMGGNDDGGYIIRPSSVTGMGRWVAVFPSYINVKWYGVKSADLQSQVTYQSSAMNEAKYRSMLIGKTLYFPADSANTYYGCDNVQLDVGNADIRMDATVRLVGKKGTTNSIKCYNLYCDRNQPCIIVEDSSDAFSVTCHEFWTSSMTGSGALHADIVHWNQPIRQNVFSDCSIIFDAEPSNSMSFDGCTLTFTDESYKFDTEQMLAFANMEFTDNYFKPGVLDYGYLTVAQSCTQDIDDFNDPVNWFNLMQEWGVEAINCQGKYMDSVTIKNKCTLQDVNIRQVVGAADAELAITTGVIGGITFSHMRTLTLNDLIIGGGNNVSNVINCASLSCKNVSYNYASASVAANSMGLTNSSFTCQLAANLLEGHNCTFSSTVATANLYAYYCTFNGIINLCHRTSFTCVMENNTIGIVSQLKIFLHPEETPSETYKATAVNCKWINNTIQRPKASGFWIVIDRTYLKADDKAHSYEYRGNVGGAQPEDGVGMEVPFVGVNGGEFGLAVLTGGTLDYTKSEDSSTGSIVMRGKCIQNFFLFSIGTENITAKVTIEFLGTRPANSLYPERKIVGYARWASIPSRTVSIISTEDSVAWPKPGATDSSQVEYHAPLEFLGGYMWGLFNTYHAAFIYSSPSSYTLLQRATGGKALLDDLGWIAGQSMPMPKMGLLVTAEVIK